MPLQKCSKDGKSGWRYGKSGMCYTGPNGKKLAIKQAIAIGHGKFPEESKASLEKEDFKLVSELEIAYNNLDGISKVLESLNAKLTENCYDS